MYFIWLISWTYFKSVTIQTNLNIATRYRCILLLRGFNHLQVRRNTIFCETSCLTVSKILLLNLQSKTNKIYYDKDENRSAGQNFDFWLNSGIKKMFFFSWKALRLSVALIPSKNIWRIYFEVILLTDSENSVSRKTRLNFWAPITPSYKKSYKYAHISETICHCNV